MQALEHVHTSIQHFLRGMPVRAAGVDAPRDFVTKAGLLPVRREGDALSFYLMQPRGDKPQLGPPPFQLCKGTRMALRDGQWHDLRDEGEAADDAEPLVVTALREGIEEIGLKLENVTALYDLGFHDFASASSGRRKGLWLFAATVRDAADFLPPDAATADCRWFTPAQYAAAGRPDHAAIMALAAGRLQEMV
jgi:hypothetical protein